jgi:serine/threonine protein kinase/predicted negative regulator of RcsB-dependent stress response
MLYEFFVKAISLSKNDQKSYLIEIKQSHPELFDELLTMIKDDETSKNMDTDYWSSMMASQSASLIHANQDLTGIIISSFKLTELIDKGGMGSVYKAQRCDGQFEQTVAIKILHSELEKIIGEHALIREAGFMAKLTHPNIGKVFDAGVSEGGHHFIVMEYIDGCSITEKFKGESLTQSVKLKLFCDLCDAVNHAHQMQVIHADLKPANILITQDNQVKILDFGISRMFNSRSSDSSAAYTSYLNAMTASYASPELLAGDNPSMYSDIYALGKIFSTLFIQQKTKEINYSGELEAIAKKATAQIPTNRYASVLELKNDLVLFLDNQVVKAFPASSLYKTKKLLFKRHPITTFLVATLLISITTLTTNLFIQQQGLIQANEQSTLLVEKFSKLFELTDKYKTNGKNYTANDLLKNAVNIVNQPSDLTPDSTAKLKLTLAKSNMSIGEYEQAKVLLLSIIESEKEILDKDIIYSASERLVQTFMYLSQYKKIESTLAHLVDKEYINGALDKRYSLAQLSFYIRYILGVYIIDPPKTMAIFKSQRKNTIKYIVDHYANELTDLQRSDYLYELGRTLYHDLPFFWIFSFEQTKDSIFDKNNAADITQAIEYLKQALVIYKLKPKTVGIEKIISAIARYYIELDQYQLAAPLLVESRNIFERDTFNSMSLMKNYDFLATYYYYDKPLKSIQLGEKALEISRNKQEQTLGYQTLDLAGELMFYYGNGGELSRFSTLAKEMAHHYLAIPQKERTLRVIGKMGFNLIEQINYLDTIPPWAKDVVATLINDLDSVKTSKISEFSPAVLEEVQNEQRGLQALVGKASYDQGRILQLNEEIKQFNGNSRSDNYNQKLTQIRLAWTLSHSGDTKAALNILSNIPEFHWNKKEIRQSTMRLSVLLMKGHIYANASELDRSIDHLEGAEKILGNIELNSNNAWEGKLLLLQGEIFLAKGNLEKAADSFKKAKPAIEKHFPANSLIVRHLEALQIKINNTIH